MKECDHPHIVQIYEIYEHENICHIVMEYYSGGSILRYASRKDIGKLRLFASKIAEQLFQTIMYLQ